jgi:hypothetical protein
LPRSTVYAYMVALWSQKITMLFDFYCLEV